MTSNTHVMAHRDRVPVTSKSRQFVTMSIDNQMLGIPVYSVRDVLKSQNLARIPLSKPEVAGAINLRGRIVTVLDLRKRLGIKNRDSNAHVMHVVVEQDDELFSIMVDSVGDVLNLRTDQFEKSPVNLSQQWKEVAASVCQLENELLVILDIEATLSL